jgi:uncharacterized protein YciI
MTNSQDSWPDLVSFSVGQGLIAKRLYVVISEPTSGLQPVLENLTAHLAYQTRLERERVMFAAGPVASDDEQHWYGEGLFIYRTASLEEAAAYAAADPMHTAGARRYRVRPWLLNEGSLGSD